MIGIHWPFVMVTTGILYILIIVNIPFNTTAATVFLFALVSYWSRIPGVGIPSPFFLIYYLDLVDLFSLLIAVNVGGWQGALFSVFGNVGSRIAGITPPWKGVIKDSISQFLLCLIMPTIFPLIGEDIFLAMILYTVVRRIGFIIMFFIYPDYSIPEFCFLWTGVTLCTLFINGFYARFFGGFFDNLLTSGVQFHWGLFIGITIIIGITKRFVLGKKGREWLQQGYLLKAFAKKMKGRKKKEQEKKHPQDEALVQEIRDTFPRK